MSDLILKHSHTGHIITPQAEEFLARLRETERLEQLARPSFSLRESLQDLQPTRRDILTRYPLKALALWAAFGVGMTAREKEAEAILPFFLACLSVTSGLLALAASYANYKQAVQANRTRSRSNTPARPYVIKHTTVLTIVKTHVHGCEHATQVDAFSPFARSLDCQEDSEVTVVGPGMIISTPGDGCHLVPWYFAEHVIEQNNAVRARHQYWSFKQTGHPVQPATINIKKGVAKQRFEKGFVVAKIAPNGRGFYAPVGKPTFSRMS